MSRLTLDARLERLETRRERDVAAKRRLPAWLIDTGCELPATSDPGWSYQALPAQRTFHHDLTTRFKGYSGPIGSGKSHAIAYEALFLSLLNPGLLGLIGAPTYKMLEDSTRRTFLEVLDTEGIDYSFKRQENCVRLSATGSEIIFRTMDNPERLRGPNLAWFALDELTYTREEAWTRMLGRLRHPQARRLCGCAVWTPKGYDWVHRRFLDHPIPDYRLIQASPKENTYLPADFYDQLKHSYADRFYRQEVLGEYLDIYGGNVYYAFSDENVQPVEYDQNLPICWALDFNVDPISSVICQIEERKPAASMRPVSIVRVLDEIVLPDSNTPAATEEFLRVIEEYENMPWPNTIKIYGDASGNSRSTKATRTDYELIREIFRTRSKFNISLHQNTANPEVQDRVNTVNNMLQTTSGTRRVVIDPKCKELIKDLRQVRWERDAYGNRTGRFDKSDPDRTHLSDALSYLIAREFGLLPMAGPREGYIL